MRCKQDIRFALCVAAVAGPATLGRVHHYPRAHGFELDIAHAGQEVAVFLDQPGTEAVLPERAASPPDTIDVLHLALAPGHQGTPAS